MGHRASPVKKCSAAFSKKDTLQIHTLFKKAFSFGMFSVVKIAKCSFYVMKWLVEVKYMEVG